MRALFLFLAAWVAVCGLPVAADVYSDARSHWAYVPPVAPPLEGRGHPIDELLAKGHREAGLRPVGEATSDVLMRRAWHVLTGLLPGEEALHLWTANELRSTEEWIGEVIERGLASPQFGERWARHWLDVARYADTKGYNFTAGRLFPFAFTYRDWVVRSLNEDLPYDEFIRRQLAADLLDVSVQEQAALGFLTIGRRFLNKNDLIIADRIKILCQTLLKYRVRFLTTRSIPSFSEHSQ